MAESSTNLELFQQTSSIKSVKFLWKSSNAQVWKYSFAMYIGWGLGQLSQYFLLSSLVDPCNKD